jgi:mediator of RNA polymerase II transcription subunit 31
MQQQYPTILPPPPLPDGTVPTRDPERQANLVRFQSELEVRPGCHRCFASQILTPQFVQCLANPQYLHELSVQKYFEQPAFIEYLKYLEYWRKPEYVRFIM